VVNSVAVRQVQPSMVKVPVTNMSLLLAGLVVISRENYNSCRS
jgi:hypothetical protein